MVPAAQVGFCHFCGVCAAIMGCAWHACLLGLGAPPRCKELCNCSWQLHQCVLEVEGCSLMLNLFRTRICT
jgi:hypothetical protein